MAVCQSAQPIPDSTFCNRFIESIRMIASVIWASRWEVSHCIACVTASASMVRLEGWRPWLCGLHCLRVQSCHPDSVGSTAIVYSPATLLDRKPPTRPVPCDWAVRVDHVACCWLRQTFVLLYWLFQLAIHGSACLGSLAAQSPSRVWTLLSVFPSPLLAWALWGRAYAGLIVLLGPSMACLLLVYTPRLLLRHREVDFGDSASRWETLWLAPS